MTNVSKPITQAQQYRIQALMDKSIYVGEMPTTSWEASCVIRNCAASKRDKEELKSKGGRVLARMTSSEVEMTTKVLSALALIDSAGVKNAKVLEGASILRSMFCAKLQ